MPIAPSWRLIKDNRLHTNTKNVEPVLLLVPRVEAFALPCLSKRATLKAPRMCIYNSIPLISWHANVKRKNGRNGYNTPMRRPRCFVFDKHLNVRSSNTSKPKRKIRLYYMYVSCPPLCPIGFQHSNDGTKLRNYCVQNKFFNKKIQKRMIFLKYTI